MSLVKVENLQKRYGPFVAVDDVSFSFPTGRIVGILGPNGCGKTTTIKVMAGLIRDYTGTVQIDGQAPGLYTKGVVSCMPDKGFLGAWMRARDAIDLFADFYSDFDRPHALDMLNQLGLKPEMPYKSMSKGMQERLILTLVMARRAKLYLLDEPLGGVDPAARSAILDIILKNYTEQSSLLISTHMIYDVERIFDQVIIMGQGRIMADDTVDNLRASTGLSLEDYFKEVFKCSVNF